jgi:UrcA family protein
MYPEHDSIQAVGRPRPRLRNLALALALVLGGAAALPASAAQSDSLPRATVSLADLDLSSIHGAETLHQRLRVAAKQVCPLLATHSAGGPADQRNCYFNALDSAVAKLRLSALTQHHLDWLADRQGRAGRVDARQQLAALR